MPHRKSHATWKGNLKEGSGVMRLDSGAYEGPYTFKSRFEEGDGTNPEELIAAAHAGCFAMALSHELAQAGHEPREVNVKADVALDAVDDGFAITTIRLKVEADVPGIMEEDFQRQAAGAKENCPVSKLLKGAKIELEAVLTRG